MGSFLRTMLLYPSYSLFFYCSLLIGIQVSTSSCGTPLGVGKSIPSLDHVAPRKIIETPKEKRTLPESLIEGPGLAHTLRGAYLIEEGMFEAAADELRLALIYFPDSPFLYSQLSHVWQALGRHSKAKETLFLGLDRAPKSPRLNYEAGMFFHREMEFKNATSYFEKALETDSQRAATFPFWISSHLWLGNLKEARAGMRALLESESATRSNLLDVAIVLEEHGLYKEASDLYAEVTGKYPDNHAASLGQMRIELLRGNINEAAKALIPLYGHHSNSVSLSSLISRLFTHGGAVEAEAYRQEAIRQTYDEERALLQVVSDDIGAGRVKEGMDLVEDLVQKNPQSQRVRLIAARMNSDQLNYAKCLQYLEQAGEQNREFNVQRALCWGGLDDLESMLGEFSFAYQKGASLKVVTEGAAYWLARKLSYDDAMNRFGSFCVELISHSLSEECIAGKAVIADFFGHGQVAIGLMEEFQILNDKREDWAIRLADLYCRYGRLIEGLEILEELVRQSPYDLVRLNALGFRLVEAGQGLEEASIWLHRAYRLAPESGFIIDSLGWLLYREGRYEQALGFIRMAVSQNPNDPEILRHLGDVYWKLGRLAEALVAYQQALSNFPNSVLHQILAERVSILDSQS